MSPAEGSSRQRDGLGPGSIVLAKGFAIGVAEQRRAIIDLGRGLLAIILGLGQQGEPAPEGSAIGSIVQPQEVRSSISHTVRYVEGRVQCNSVAARSPAR